MTVFISYGSAADQVTALRLQALAAVNGLTVYVPAAFTRLAPPSVLDPNSYQKLNEADVILGVVGTGLSDACRQELSTGIQLGKNTIVMAHPFFATQLTPHFGANLVVIDPSNPGQAELDIVQHLKAITAEKSSETALLALGTLALGLFIFTLASNQRS